jgi:hypothetical protein
VPQGKLRQALMHGAHDALVAGHLGFNKAYERLSVVPWVTVHSLHLVTVQPGPYPTVSYASLSVFPAIFHV